MDRPTASRLSPVLCVFSLAAGVAAAEPRQRLVPAPQQVQWLDQAPLALPPDQVVILIGDLATEPERYAARTLQAAVEKRFGLRWHIMAESKDRKAYAVELLLGQRDTHKSLDALCARMKIDLSRRSPGHDGYVITFARTDGREVVIVGGSDARGVIYGQDTLFQLIGQRGGGLVLRRASIRDYPSIPWRGRPQTSVSHYLKPDEMDAYAAARINFIDLREGTYAVEPGAKLDEDTIRKAVAEARRRGMVTFAVVNCGVRASEYEKVMQTFRDFLSLGADGLWLSFDDKGPGENPERLVFDVLALGRQHQITGPQIAITPPKGSYQTVADNSNGDFNRRIMKVPGMENALWFWTPPPTMERLEEARAIGLKVGVSWWHNWPRPFPGFAHIKGGHIVAQGQRGYMEIPPLREGWNRPSYDLLAQAGRCTEAVMPWGGNSWGARYLIPVVGWWGWNPAGHVWDDVRARICDAVYGPDQVAAVMAFDDKLVEVKKLFRYGQEGNAFEPVCPARLQRLEDRDRAMKLLGELEALHQAISAAAPRQTMIEESILAGVYLDAMATEVRTGKAAAVASYPEYWYPAHQRSLLEAIHASRLDEADRLAGAVRGRILKDVEQIRGAMGHLTLMPDYVKFWTQRAGMTGRDWQKLLADRKAMMDPHVFEFDYYVYVTDKMLAGLGRPPLRWGSGGATQQNRVLATVLPGEQEQFWGKWVGGIHHRKDGTNIACFWLGRDGTGTVGGYSELPVEIPVSGRRDALSLLLYVAHWNRESLGLETVANRWGGYRVMQLLAGDELLWEIDIGVHRNDGEWFLVKLPPVAPDVSVLKLRLRVEDRREPSLDTMVLVGPIRLIEMTQ